MSSSDARLPTGPLTDALLAEAGLRVSRVTLLETGRIREIDRSPLHDYLVAIRDSTNAGSDIVLNINIPQSCELRRAARNNDKALALLGRLTDSLIGSGTQAELQSDATGLCGLLLLRHICRDRLDAPRLRAEIASIEELASRIKNELLSAEPALLNRLAAALRTEAASEALTTLKYTSAVVPTFDQSRRAEQMVLRPAG
jgi:hypothetical protein